MSEGRSSQVMVPLDRPWSSSSTNKTADVEASGPEAQARGSLYILIRQAFKMLIAAPETEWLQLGPFPPAYSQSRRRCCPNQDKHCT
jgi:hypothetical protein